tara:strand:- start:76 stop:420 length:345 start_codon:yes stop_codon:yes gene_type:complete
MKPVLSDILGYIGAFFLIIRLTPIIHEQLNEPSKLNLYFLGMEFMACMFLGASAILIRSTPFIIANILSFVNLMIIISVQIRIRCFKNTLNEYNERYEMEKHDYEIPDVRIVVS